MIKFLLVGFPSPWRWARRRYWKRIFNGLTEAHKYLAEMGHIDPESLIERGEL